MPTITVETEFSTWVSGPSVMSFLTVLDCPISMIQEVERMSERANMTSCQQAVTTVDQPV